MDLVLCLAINRCRGWCVVLCKYSALPFRDVHAAGHVFTMLAPAASYCRDKDNILLDASVPVMSSVTPKVAENGSRI